MDLLEQLRADGGGLLTAGGVGLHHGGDLANGLGHLGQGSGLLLDGLGDGGDGVVGLHHQLLGLFQGAGYLVHDLGAPLGGLDGVPDEILGGLGRLVGFGGQVAHLIGYHGEALARRARPSGLHRRVQRQDVGLEGDVLNGGDNLANLLGGVGDVRHGGHHLLHLLAAHVHLLAGETGALLGGGGGLGIAGGALGQIVRRGVQLLHRAGLLGGALGQGLSPAGQLLGVAAHPLLRLDDVAQRAGYGGGKALQRFLDGLEVADVTDGRGHVEVALRQFVHHPVDVIHILVDAFHGLLQRLGQLPQLVFGLIVKIQRQVAVLKGPDLLGDEQQRLDDVVHHIDHQADERDEVQQQAHNGGAVHEADDAAHFIGILIAEGLAPLHHLVQQAHQLGQVGLDGVLVIRLGLGVGEVGDTAGGRSLI